MVAAAGKSMRGSCCSFSAHAFGWWTPRQWGCREAVAAALGSLSSINWLAALPAQVLTRKPPACGVPILQVWDKAQKKCGERQQLLVG